MHGEELKHNEGFSLHIRLLIRVNKADNQDKTRGANAKMREETKEDSVCLLKIQRGRKLSALQMTCGHTEERLQH